MLSIFIQINKENFDIEIVFIKSFFRFFNNSYIRFHRLSIPNKRIKILA